MRRFRLFFMFGVILLWVSILLQSTFTQALYAPAAGSGTGATPQASPSVGGGWAIKATSAAVATITIPSGGSTPAAAGDCMMAVYSHITNDGTSYPNSTTPLGIASDLAGSLYTTNINFGMLRKYITNQDITTGNISLGQMASTNDTIICANFYRHVTCGQDGAAHNNSSAGSTSPAPGSVTTVSNGDMIINGGIFNTAGAYTPPAGFTNDQYLNAINGTALGCWMDHSFQATAGASNPTGTLANSSPWGDIQDALRNIAGTP